MAASDSFEDILVSWQVDGVEIEASLTRPLGAGPFPAIIMVAGSGPTDRNWNTPLIPGTNGSAALLARALTARGFITLRYDKSASGPHARENVQRLAGKLSLQSHLAELAGGVQLLAERADVLTDHLFGLGNSEGCLHVLNYQTRAAQPLAGNRPMAGLVLTAAPARVIGVLARAQIAAQLASLPGGDQLMAAYDAALADFAADRPVNVDPNLPVGLRNVILGITNPVNQPFARELWVTDPLAMLARVTAPVLIIIGKKDIQVDWQVDGALFEAAAKDHPNLTLVYPDNANHVLKYEPKDRSQLTPDEVTISYGAADTVLDAEVVETIAAWLAGHI